MNYTKNITKEFIENKVLTLDLEVPETMIIWAMRHWANSPKIDEDPRELFALCIEQHKLPDISVLFEELIQGITEGSLFKGVIGQEFCNHLHYGEFKVLETLYLLQNDQFNLANESLSGWLETNQARILLKILSALGAILEKSNLIIPPRREYKTNWQPH
tara:strand:- start:3527 stop:4006 length:480 start_codon:yes stop_codon:yes gene_type:complete